MGTGNLPGGKSMPKRVAKIAGIHRNCKRHTLEFESKF